MYDEAIQTIFIETDVQSVDPNQMPCSVASDLDLHCFSMSFLWTGIQMNFGLFFMLSSRTVITTMYF